MRILTALAAGCAAAWLALFGLFELVRHTGVVEVLCLEIAAFVLALLTIGLIWLEIRATVPETSSRR